MNYEAPIACPVTAVTETSPAQPRLRTDLATVLLHWSAVLLFGISLATGLRIAADVPDASWSRWLAPGLPQGNVVLWHVVSACGLIATIVGYITFLIGARLTPRIALDAGRFRALSSRHWRIRWQSINVAIYWLAFAAMMVAVAAGILLYVWPQQLPHAPVATVHRAAAWGLLGYLGLHVGAQAMLGGCNQLLKILRPRLAYGRPATIAAVAAAAAIAVVLAVDHQGLKPLTMLEVLEPPRIDGASSDMAWLTAPPAMIATARGANLKGGEAIVTVRAVRDRTHAYFLFEWPDATRSQKHLPLIKSERGWRVLETDYTAQDEDAYYEDKFSMLLSRRPTLAAAGTVHLGPKPLADRPGPTGGRGLHYTTDDSIVDMWHWKSVRTGPMAQIDDNYFGPPLEAPAHAQERYTGGYTQDPKIDGGFLQNWRKLDNGTVQPLRLPKDAAVLRRLGTVDLDPTASDAGEWWLPIGLTVPYSAEADQLLPVGTVLPSVVIEAPFAGDRGDVKAVGRWDGGVWRLEASRRLDTGSPHDVPIADGVYVWVAVFDHTQTRHSQHLHPLRLQFR